MIKWIKPFGDIFVNLLKLIAIPLIIASLLKGISDLKDISKFARIGGRSILIYIGTTVVAIIIGLAIVNLVNPGNGISEETKQTLIQTYEGNSGITGKLNTAASQQESGPLDFLVDMVPSNLFGAMSDNGNMLQVIFFIIFFGIAMLLVPEKSAKPIKDFFDGLNDIVLKMVDIIMLFAPFAVFALLATVIVTSESWEIIYALLKYGITVIIGLLLMIVFYFRKRATNVLVVSNITIEGQNARLLELNENLRKSESTLRHSNTTKDKFISIIAHDLKNPINNIKGLVEIMDDSDLGSQNEIKTMLMESANLLEEKIKATLETIKQMQANKNNVDVLSLHDVLEEVKSSLLMLIKNNKVNFQINFKEETINYNKSILESIFYNLISNAIKYGSDIRQKKVIISSDKEGEYTVLRFEDNGIGFDTTKDMDKVFSIFERVHEQGEATGTGIGLYMIKQMIELNGGKIEVESEVDKGTTFIVKLKNMN